MTLYSETVSISATTAGVAGSINVPNNARLVGINMSATGTAGVTITKIAVAWPGCPTPLTFTPGISVHHTTNGGALGICNTPLIKLPMLNVGSANVITVTVTSTGNETVQIGLMWVA